jgi:hypothetical protein
VADELIADDRRSNTWRRFPKRNRFGYRPASQPEAALTSDIAQPIAGDVRNFNPKLLPGPRNYRIMPNPNPGKLLLNQQLQPAVAVCTWLFFV